MLDKQINQKMEKSVISYETRSSIESHHIEDFKAPDWKIYKIENTTELLKVKNRLAQLGLKDNWLRYYKICVLFVLKNGRNDTRLVI